MIETLEAQRAAFSSDDHIRERASAWMDASPAECLRAVDESCAEAAFFLERLSPEDLERALAPDPLPAETLELLAMLWGSRPR